MEIDILGQPIQIYTQILFCYGLPPTDNLTYAAAQRDAIVSTLRDGLAKVAAAFPWLTGKVSNQAADGNTGFYKIVPHASTIPLVVKDLSASSDAAIPNMDALREAGFPFHLLDENLVAPRRTLPGSSPAEAALLAADPSMPVFWVQATFLPGGRGLLLCFVGHHAAMDMTGQGFVMEWIDKACRGVAFTDLELRRGNIAARDAVVPPLADAEGYDPAMLADQRIPPAAAATSDAPVPAAFAKATWAYFDFARDGVEAVKRAATETIPAGSPTTFVSSDDALTAFVWQAIVRARLPRLPGATTGNARLARAVDVRPLFFPAAADGGRPSYYPGLLQNMTYHAHAPAVLADPGKLGAVAADLRAQLLDGTALRTRTRALATLMAREGPAAAGFTANLDLATDLMLSSWTKVDCYAMQFALGLGAPEKVRRPAFTPFESLLYLMPRDRDGGVGVGLCLRDEDLERLRQDSMWIEHCKYVG